MGIFATELASSSPPRSSKGWDKMVFQLIKVFSFRSIETLEDVQGRIVQYDEGKATDYRRGHQRNGGE